MSPGNNFAVTFSFPVLNRERWLACTVPDSSAFFPTKAHLVPCQSLQEAEWKLKTRDQGGNSGPIMCYYENNTELFFSWVSPVCTKVLPAVQYLISMHLVPRTERILSWMRVRCHLKWRFVPLSFAPWQWGDKGDGSVVGENLKRVMLFGTLHDHFQARTSGSLHPCGIARCSEHPGPAFLLVTEAPHQCFSDSELGPPQGRGLKATHLGFSSWCGMVQTTAWVTIWKGL